MSVLKTLTLVLIGQYVPIIKVVMNVDVVLDGRVIRIGTPGIRSGPARPLRKNQDVK